MRRSLVAFILAASFFTSLNPTSLFDPLWTWLSSLRGDSADSKIGCGWDPDGVNKEGCGWDPNGVNNPTPPPSAEIGCGWDPNGADSCEPPKI